ncbi:PREDICTED: translocation protein SEC63 homolog [Nicrophorus vespilloides]|uniref:Translocation protein SEC63 homolog n=1 Tax=Nicrophorus vespilloides TaxID=110193 RepID=A0ABM1MPN1_NICVS|nr:PREDICTED: translocation protein SEC63 homolog [Nicrophorus vespilloides]XP_017776532.1 PREDICTED: translocation protein SEC63 homolog [Nicrophorus vespilloides]
MGGQKFQYDESGGTFFYFLLSFLALTLIPATLYYWPRKQKEDPEKVKRQCKCEQCSLKREHMKTAAPWKGPKNLFIKFVIILGWIILILIAYKVSQFDYEMSNFDPYEILKVPVGASQAEIKKAYRKQSVILHPDKETGNEKEFMRLSKAYQALTDDEARKNWEKYGNPDGPGAMSFGIALPSWIVEKKNSIWVLGLYGLVFMVALPIVVGTWWYRSIRFSGDKVLLDTTQMYYFFFHKTPHMMWKRVIMILAASFEFDKKYNSEIVTRPSDDEEVPQLTKSLPNLGEKNKERPLCFPYSIKARALIHAHLMRVPLNPSTLEIDRRYIINKCPYLIQEQVNSVNQLILLAYARRIPKLPSIETIENCMRICPMVVQGIWEVRNIFLQLPHITMDNLRYFQNKKRPIKTLQQFAQLKPTDRRNILKSLSDEEYEDVMKVLGSMPCVDFQVKCEVVDDENSTEVTAGAIVTVTVTLVRKDLKTLFKTEPVVGEKGVENGIEEDNADEESKVDPKKPAWQKNRKKYNKKAPKTKSKVAPAATSSVKVKPDESPAPTVTKVEKANENVENSDDSDSEVDTNDRSSDDEVKNSNVEDDDQEWEKFQQKVHKRDGVLEGKSKMSHSVVHCPYFPSDKQEYWWTYICDRKSRTLLTQPYHITSLVDKEEYHLRFTAPNWKGVYYFTVCLRSDSYLGFDQQKDIKLDVKEAPTEITDHPQWEFENSEEEDQVADDGHESEFTTDDDLPDDDDH